MNYKIFLVCLLSILLVACASGPQEGGSTASTEPETSASQSAQQADTAVVDEPASSAATSKTPIYVLANIPYSANSSIDEKIKSECWQLGQQLSSSMVKYASKFDIEIVQIGGKLPDTGRAAVVQIVNAYSAGNAFIGHHKSVTVRVKLMVDGEVKGKTRKKRNSSGGFLGGFTGSCGVLERTVNTLGSDVADWLSEQ